MIYPRPIEWHPIKGLFSPLKSYLPGRNFLPQKIWLWVFFFIFLSFLVGKLDITSDNLHSKLSFIYGVTTKPPEENSFSRRNLWDLNYEERNMSRNIEPKKRTRERNSGKMDQFYNNLKKNPNLLWYQK